VNNYLRSAEGETGSTFQYIGSRLGMNNVVFAAAWDNFGNAIISKSPLESTSCKAIKISQLEVRTLCCAVLRSPTSQLYGIFCTHLDHIKEPNRIEQLKIALDHITTTYPNLPHLFIGDFNSLTKGDYIDSDWEQITQHRVNSSWEPPMSLVTTFMRERGYKDAWASKNNVPAPREKIATCWAQTRIDYIWVSPNFPWEIHNCWRGDSDASDHVPVFADIVFS